MQLRSIRNPIINFMQTLPENFLLRTDTLSKIVLIEERIKTLCPDVWQPDKIFNILRVRQSCTGRKFVMFVVLYVFRFHFFLLN